MAAVRAGCSQIGRSSSAMVAKIGSKAGSSSGLPAMLVKIWMPPAPSSLTARRASFTEPSTSVIDSAATKVGKRSGCRAHSSAMASLPIRARLRPVVAGGKVLDRRIRQRDDLAVVAELVHLAEALVEVEQLFHAAQARADIAEPRRNAIHLLEELVREDVAVDVDDRLAGHGVLLSASIRAHPSCAERACGRSAPSARGSARRRTRLRAARLCDAHRWSRLGSLRCDAQHEADRGCCTVKTSSGPGP